MSAVIRPVNDTLAVGISKSNIWWWLSGNNQHTIDVIKGILRESGLTFEEAFGGAE